MKRSLSRLEAVGNVSKKSKTTSDVELNSENEEQESYNLSHQLMEDMRRLKKLKQSQDDKTKLEIRADVIKNIRAIVNLRYDGLLKKSLGTDDDDDVFADHGLNLQYTVHSLAVVHNIQPLNSDLIKWVMVKLVLSRTSTLINEKMGDALQQAILVLYRLLPTDCQEELAFHIIQQMIGILNGRVSKLVFHDETSDQINPEFKVSVPVHEINETQKLACLSLIELLRHGSVNFKTLNDTSVTGLWCCLYEMCAEASKAIFIDFKILMSCFDLMQMLFHDGIWRPWICGYALDVGLSIYTQLFASDRDALPELQKNISLFLKVFAETVLNKDSEYRDDLGVGDIFDWAQKIGHIIKLLLSKPNHDSTEIETLFNVLCIFLKILVSIKDCEFLDDQSAVLFANTIKELIEYYLNLSTKGYKKAVVLRLRPMLIYIFHMDRIKSNSINGDWFLRLCRAKSQGFEARYMNEEIIALRHSLASAMMIIVDKWSYKELLKNFLPTRAMIERWISVAVKTSSGTSFLLKMFKFIAEVAPKITEEIGLNLALLSIPWLKVIDLSTEQQHRRRLPLLKSMEALAKSCRDNIDGRVLCCTLKSICCTQVEGWTEWRRQVFEIALHSHDMSIVETALNSFAELIASIAPSAHGPLFQTLIEAIPENFLTEVDGRFASGCLAAFAKAICASDSSAEVLGSIITCKTCTRSQRGEEPSENRIKIPEKLAKILLKIFMEGELRQSTEHLICLRKQACALLWSCLAHDHKVSDEIIFASFGCIQDPEEEVRTEFLASFKFIVSSLEDGKEGKKIADAIQEALKTPDLNQISLPSSKVYRTFAPYLYVGAIYSQHSSLAKFCFIRFVTRWMRLDDDSVESAEIDRLVIKMIQDKAKQQKISIQSLFLRNSREISKELAEELRTLAFTARTLAEQNLSPEEANQEAEKDVDTLLDNISHVFEFGSSRSFLNCAAVHVVSYLLLVCDVDNYHRDDIFLCLNRICVALNKTRADLLVEVLPSVMEKGFERDLIHKLTTDRLRAVYQAYANVDIDKTWVARRYQIVYALLRSLCYNTEKVLQLLGKSLPMSQEPLVKEKNEALTHTLRYNCEYLGYLLSFRCHLQDDENYELRETMLDSLAIIIRLMNRNFLERISTKILVVLRTATTTLGQMCLKVWCEFARALPPKQRSILLPQILIAVEPLCVQEESHEVLEALFEKDSNGQLERRVAILPTARVLAWQKTGEPTAMTRYLKRMVIGPNEAETTTIIEDAVKMLCAECDVVGRVVLQKLLSNLDGTLADESSIGLLVRALLHTIRNCGQVDVRELAARCLGRIGAVDPGRVGLSLTHRMANRNDQPQTENVFVNDSNNKFVIYLLERCWRVYSTIVDPDLINKAEYSLQKLLKTLGGMDLLAKIDNAQCRQDLEPLVSTKLVTQTPPKDVVYPTPIVTSSTSYINWLLDCFLMGISHIFSHPLCDVFTNLRSIADCGDAPFLCELLPHVITQLIIEMNVNVVKKFTDEMEACMRIATETAGWQRMAANAVFCIIDSLEAFILKRKKLTLPRDQVLAMATQIHTRMVGLRTKDGEFLVVLAAEKCGCLLRALRWCEQYALHEVDPQTERHSLYVIERIYTALADVDGVQGSFETIRKKNSPTPDETILACEAIGDFSEAMPLYEQCSENKEFRLLKALISLNQPMLALTTAEEMYQRYSPDKTSSTLRAIEDIQMEAAWHLRDWGKLGERIEKFQPFAPTRDTSWGASCATVLHAVRKGDANLIDRYIIASRKRVIDRLVTITMEDADAYAQSYEYFTRLHILDEIEEFSSASEDLEVRFDDILKKWQTRSEMVIQDASFLEPILRVRRELVSDGPYASQKCQLLLQSSRLARQAGHLQIAWTFLVEAKALNVCDFELAAEEARFLFQKNAAPASISVLNRMLVGPRFSELNNIFNTLKTKRNDEELKKTASQITTSFPKDLRAQYAEIQVMYAEYNQKAGTRDANDLYSTYNCLRYLDVKSEDLYYRIAVFFDALFEKSVEASATRADNLVKHVLRSYMDVLRNGRSHSLHVMPRMLTIWLNYTENKYKLVTKDTDAATKKNIGETIDILCGLMRNAWEIVDPVLFFESFPQLISRICHPSINVFELLKEILSGLIQKFPHQSLWQSVAVYRPDRSAVLPSSKSMPDKLREEKNNFMKLRLKRIHQIFESVLTASPELTDLVDQYDYVSYLLLNFAEKDLNAGQYSNLSAKFPELFNFFTSGKIILKHLARTQVAERFGIPIKAPMPHAKRDRSVKVEIMIPYTELMMRAVNYAGSERPLSSSQFCFNGASQAPNAMIESSAFREEVFIRDVFDDYQVFASLAKPKKFTIRGYDGKRYDLLAKGGDELRKDARFNDVNRMMNCLMKRNPMARRRQLMVKTYTVVPLASEGGIMEWLPNLETYRSVLAPLCLEKSGKGSCRVNFNDFAKKSDEERIKAFYETFYPAYPLVLSEWFRRTFNDPCSWHSARLAYARSTAVMSMIGFVMGLGDRHAENILIDKVDGVTVHVDFNLIFNKGETLPVPEIVPFRLTRNMVDGLGPTGVEGAFRKSCEAAMSVMRENKETLLTVITTFVHDPLLEFFKQAERDKKQVQQSNKQSLPTEIDVMSSEAKERVAKTNVLLITKRLEGHIVSMKNQGHVDQTSPMIVEGQVDRLIEMAMDETLLSRMYLGWSPYF